MTLKKKDLHRFTVLLKEEKARILNQLEKTKKADLTLKTEDLPDEVDLASSELNQSMSLRIRDRERELVLRIEEALVKIENGTYGLCEMCEEPIEVKRLEAQPIAEMCIRCKEQEEIQRKIYA
ncbi:MAG: conjugal transfer protein TraR [Proteobacteria bacterium]|nr:conjugal transfer protein TraR [Pseudomonadota bacterium]NDC24018.1 conjugal transfer protein TraR [Pseudomonadota bacterium]NDD04031.1 conjugal transfer protein TraR [Pseudomonadota bacterium]NDG26626.1 conjugal transfer protein TraR [Pseudomonadota bacterium]